MIRETRIGVTTTGSAGSATGSSIVGLHGVIDSFYITYSGSAPGTTDTVITWIDGAGNTRETLWTKNNSVTAHTARPRVAVTDNAAAATGGYDYYSIPNGSNIKVSVTGCDELTDAVVVYAVYEESNT